MSDVPIDRAEVLRIAALAKLELDERDLEQMTRDLAKILAYVRQLQQVAVDDVEPTSHVLLERLPLRADEPGPSLDRAQVLEQAPRCDASGFSVPVYVDEG